VCLEQAKVAIARPPQGMDGKQKQKFCSFPGVARAIEEFWLTGVDGRPKHIGFIK
jgi:hypothetical protein